MKFIALTLVFAFLLSGCSTKKNRQEWNSYNENEEWSYFMPEDVDRDVVPFYFRENMLQVLKSKSKMNSKPTLNDIQNQKPVNFCFMIQIWELFRRKWTVKEFWKSIFKITRLHKKALEEL